MAHGIAKPQLFLTWLLQQQLLVLLLPIALPPLLLLLLLSSGGRQICTTAEVANAPLWRCAGLCGRDCASCSAPTLLLGRRAARRDSSAWQ